MLLLTGEMITNLLLILIRPKQCLLVAIPSYVSSTAFRRVSVLDNQLDIVRSFKCLGVVLSSNFTWTEHVKHVISKVNQRFGLLRGIKHLLLYNARLLYYKSLVLPILDYADMV